MTSSAASGSLRRGAFGRLAAISGMDMLRNPLTGLSMVFLFAMMLGVSVAIWLAFTVVGPAAAVTVTGAEPEVVTALERSGVSVVDADSPHRNATISVDGEKAIVTLDAGDPPAWNSIWRGLRDAGVPAAGITVVNDVGEQVPDVLRSNLGVTLMMGIASTAFIGTTVPLVAARERGLLRLLGTTPLRRSTFLLGQVPARVLVAVTFMAATLAIALWQRYVDGIDLIGLGITFIFSTTMLLSFGLLCAARARNEESTQQSMVMLTILLTFASGGLLPSSLVPEVVQIFLNALPTTWVAVAAGSTLTGAPPFLPVSVLWVLMAVATVVAIGLAARLFEWDQSEPSRRRSPLHIEERRSS